MDDATEPAPRVGVIIRTKDRPEFLARALRDVADQRFEDWRIVIVNDGGDPEAVEAVVASCPIAVRVETISTTPERHGRCVAANDGIRAAGTEFVVLHDDDDLWHPDFLAETVAWLDAHPADAGVMVPTEIRYEERRGDVWVETGRTPFWAGMDRISLSELLTVNRAVPISFLYRAELHETFGWYDETLDAVEDWDFTLRVLPRRSIGFIPGRVLATWAQRPSTRGADGNSMFELGAEHARDDAIVRDRALAAWIAAEGPGLPLYLAQIETRLQAHIDRRFDELRDQVDGVRRENVPGRQLAALARRIRRRRSD